jgi:transposase
VRVPPKLMGCARRAGRRYGKSDAIDALAVARACLREPKLPAAFLAGAEREIKLVLDHREDLVAERSRIQQRLRWHLHDLEPDFEIPAGALDCYCWLERIEVRLGGRRQSVRVDICRELVLRCRELTRRAKELERELAPLVSAQAAPLLVLDGCGLLSAAKLVGEAAGAERFASDAAFAMHSGSAPLEASSGLRQRNRLKEAEGKSRKEALRCLKRHLARTVYTILTQLQEAKMHDVERPVPTPALT